MDVKWQRQREGRYLQRMSRGERERDEDLERKMRKYEMDKQLKELTASATVERKEGLLRFEKMENEN